MNKKEVKKQKLVEWLQMEDSERRKFNGYAGWVTGSRWKDGNAFSDHEEEKRRRKRLKERKK